MKQEAYFTWRDLFSTIPESHMDDNVIVEIWDENDERTLHQADMSNSICDNNLGLDGGTRVITVLPKKA